MEGAISWEQDHLRLWEAINALREALVAHTSACEVRNTEVTRRQEESMRDRHALNLKQDALLARLNNDQLASARNQNRLLITMVAGIGSVLVSLAGAAANIFFK